MIRYEMKKLLRSRVGMLLMVLFLVINGVAVWNLDTPGVAPYTDMDVTHILSLYKALPADGTQALAALEGKRDLLTQAIWEETDPGGYLTEDVYTERILFVTLIDRIEPVVNYRTLLQDIDSNAQTLLLTGRYEEDSFAYRNVVESRQLYERLRPVEPTILYSGAIELLPGGGITEIMVVLLSFLIGLELIFTEREQGTLALCKPTCHGGGKLIGAKILAGIAWGALGTLLLYGTNALIGLIRCGGVDLSAPLQSVFGMIRSPWRLTIGEYIAVFFVSKLLWTASVMAVAYGVCYLGKKVWQCCILFLLLGGICFLRPGSVMNPFSMGNSWELFGNYWNLNLFGFPVSNLTVSILGTCAVSVFGFLGVILLHVKRAPGISERSKTNRKSKPYVPTGIMSYEARKLFLMNGGLYIFLLLAVVQIGIYADFPHHIPPAEQMYIRYSQVLSGKADGEKDAYIAQEEARFAELYQKLEEYGEDLALGNISQESYTALTGGIMGQLDSEPAFLRARDQYMQMKGRGLDYVCLTGYNRLLGVEGKQELLRQSILLILGLAGALSGVFATEYETGMILLLRTVEGEEGSKRKKRLLAILYAIGLWALTYIPQIVSVWAYYGLPGMGAGAGSVPGLGPEFGTVWSTLGIYGGILAGLSVGVALGILLLSKVTRNTVHTLLYSCALFLPPCIVGMMI